MSPKTWIVYWWGAIALGLAILIYGIVGGGVLMVFLGVAMIVAGVGLIGFWRRIQAKGPRDSSPN